MATFNQTLVAFALHTGNVAYARAHSKEAKAALYRGAAAMTDDQKVKANREVVQALCNRFGLHAVTSERPMFCGLTFEQKSSAGKAASVALSRARSILKVASMAEAREKIAQMDAQPKKRSALASLLKAFEKLTPAQRKAFLAKAKG